MSDSKPIRDIREDDAIAQVERLCQKAEVECEKVMWDAVQCQEMMHATAQELENLELELRGHRPYVAQQCALFIRRTISVLARQGVPTQPLERAARAFEERDGQDDGEPNVTP
jgi:hypothetical protein